MSEEEIQKQSVGSQLCKAREQQQLTQDSVASRLNLSIATIEALEVDAADKLPPPSFTRGYLRAYAKLLDIDADNLITTYNQSGPVEPELMSINPMANEARRHPPAIGWATLVIALILMALLGAWWYGWHHAEGGIDTFELWPEKENVETEQDATEQNASYFGTTPSLEAITKINEDPTLPEDIEQRNTESNQTEESVLNNIVDDAKQIEPGTGVDNTEDVDTEQLQKQDTLADGEASVAEFIDKPLTALTSINEAVNKTNKQKSTDESLSSESDTLQIQTENSSWVEVIDDNGDRLMYNMLSSEQECRLRGTAPFLIFLGHTPGISMIMNGTVVKNPEYSQTSKTSRFIIHADGSLHL